MGLRMRDGRRDRAASSYRDSRPIATTSRLAQSCSIRCVAPRSRQCHNSLMKPAALLCGTLLAAVLAAQTDFTKPAPAGARVTMASAAPVTLTPAKPGSVELQFRVAPGFHINSNKPSNEFLIPTVLTLDAQTGLMISKVTYPPAEDVAFAFSPNEKLNVYTGDFTIGAQVRAASSTPVGRYRIHGRLTAQACDNKMCYPPKDIPVAFDVQVRRAPSGTPRRNPGQSPHVKR